MEGGIIDRVDWSWCDYSAYKMKTFILHWRDGSTSQIEGETIADAFNRAGFGQGSLPALDYWELKKVVEIRVTVSPDVKWSAAIEEPEADIFN